MIESMEAPFFVVLERGEGPAAQSDADAPSPDVRFPLQ